MLTLKELKKIVKVADMEKRIPSVRFLKEHDVVVKEILSADTDISVYDNGYVLYKNGSKTTVFPLHTCGEYAYEDVTGNCKVVNEEFFDNENWYIRLLMEAEDRMEFNQSKIRSNHHTFSYSELSLEMKFMEDPSMNFTDGVMNRTILCGLMQDLTDKQKIVLELFYFQEMRQKDIADYLGIKQQSVMAILNRALNMMRKKAGNDEI